jgi:hypothetical protein
MRLRTAGKVVGQLKRVMTDARFGGRQWNAVDSYAHTA